MKKTTTFILISTLVGCEINDKPPIPKDWSYRSIDSTFNHRAIYKEMSACEFARNMPADLDVVKVNYMYSVEQSSSEELPPVFVMARGEHLSNKKEIWISFEGGVTDDVLYSSPIQIKSDDIVILNNSENKYIQSISSYWHLGHDTMYWKNNELVTPLGSLTLVSTNEKLTENVNNFMESLRNQENCTVEYIVDSNTDNHEIEPSEVETLPPKDERDMDSELMVNRPD